MPATQSTIGGPDRIVTVHAAQAGRMPNLADYVADLWTRRRFIGHLAGSNLKASHADTMFGQLWQVLNPLLLGLVYYLVVNVIRGTSAPEGYLAYLMGGLFLYYYVRNAMGSGANSVVNSGGLLLNSAFPRAVLPLSSTLAATYNYLPTLLVYLTFHMFGGDAPYGRLHWTMLLVPVLSLVPLAVFSFGLAMLSATTTVFFRDTTSFLPYLLRIWLYLSPVLLTYDQVVLLVAGGLEKFGLAEATASSLAPGLAYLNPMVGFLGVWHRLVTGSLPTDGAMIASVVWALGAVAVGGWFFLSNEREFAFRV